VRVADEIMSNYQHVVSELKLVPGAAGIFDVMVEPDGDADGDGVTERIYSKQQTGRQANPGEVLAAFEAMLPAGTLRYGT
jgi:predicted Rdx family selenoprotein